MDASLITQATGVADLADLAQIAKILDETVFFSRVVGTYTSFQTPASAQAGAVRANQIRLGQLARHGAQLRTRGLDVHEALVEFEAARAKLNAALTPALARLAEERFPIDSVQQLGGVRFTGFSNKATTAIVRRHNPVSVDYGCPELSEVSVDATPIRKDGQPALTIVRLHEQPVFDPDAATQAVRAGADPIAGYREALHRRLNELDELDAAHFVAGAAGSR